MNNLLKKKRLSLVDDIEDVNVRQLRSGPETEMEKIYALDIQSRIHQSALNNRHIKISQMAYTLWQQEGCPEPGDPLNNWFEAEKKIASETRYPPHPPSDPPRISRNH